MTITEASKITLHREIQSPTRNKDRFCNVEDGCMPGNKKDDYSVVFEFVRSASDRFEVGDLILPI